MAIIRCRECGSQVSTDAAFCPHCGVPPVPGTQPPALRAARPAPTGTGGRRLFDVLNAPLLGIVSFMFLMPLLELSCGSVKATYTGVNLAFGTEPTVVGAPRSSDAGQQETPSDLPLLLVPFVGVLGALRFLGALQLAGPLRTSEAFFLPAVLAGTLGIYAAIGFAPEREIARKLDAPGIQNADPGGLRQTGSDLDNSVLRSIACEKTPWFYVALIGSCLAAAFAALRDRSPTIGAVGTAPAIRP